MLQKIASGTPYGRLTVSEDVFYETMLDLIGDAEYMPKGEKRLWALLRIARICADARQDAYALEYYRNVFFATIKDGKIMKEYRMIANEAYQGMAGLALSQDEYVWESVSQTLYDCRQLLAKGLKQK